MKIIFLILVLSVVNTSFAAKPPLPHEPGIYKPPMSRMLTWRQEMIRKANIDIGAKKYQLELQAERDKYRAAVDYGRYQSKFNWSTRALMEEDMKLANKLRSAHAKLELLNE